MIKIATRRRGSHTMKTALRVALFAALLHAVPAVAQNPFAEPKAAPLPIPRYQKITKFAVRYHDLILNQIEGTAWCNWKQQHCSVGLRHPTTKAISWLNSESIELTNKWEPLTSPVRIKLFGDSPWREKVTTPALPGTVVHGGDGDTAQIALGDGGPGLIAEAYTNKHARADYTITLDLVPDKDGALVGRWSYLSDPVTERNHSKGTYGDRVGIFEPLGEINLNRVLKDRLHVTSVPADYGGFLGLQQGGEYWEPLPPHIHGVFVLEDQAAFSGGKPYYPHPHGAYRSSRTIIVIGRDLPIDRSAPLAEIETKDEGFEYNVSAVAGTARVTDEQKQDFERAWTALTRDMSSDEAADFRKLDAVRVYVEFRNAEPGKKMFSWGGADVPWQLQYGDNTADVRIARRVTEAETEPVDQLALPEEVFVEVETGTKIESDTIPIQFGGQGVAGAPADAVAVRVKDNLYRSAPFVASAPEDLARVALSGKLLVPIVKGGRLAVTVNRDKT